MIQISLTEQELFDIIMAVYSASRTENSPDAPAHEVATAIRRKSILDKLHEAFEQNADAEKEKASETATVVLTEAQ
jgi:hypothetical protein